MSRHSHLILAAATLLATPAPAQDKLPTPTASGYAEVNGLEVYYATYGQGDPIVLLHGGFGLIEMFDPVIATLAENHTVIGVALRMGIDYPAVVDRLVLIFTPYAFEGWHDFNANGMRGMAGAIEQTAEGLKQTPIYQGYVSVAPDPENWLTLVTQMAGFIGNDYDWSDEMTEVTAPTMLVSGDWDGVRTSHLAQFFELLGGGLQDAQWDRSGMNANRLAILPGTTHYDIFASPALAQTIIGFIDAE